MKSTALPQLLQNLAPSGSSFPQNLQNIKLPPIKCHYLIKPDTMILSYFYCYFSFNRVRQQTGLYSVQYSGVLCACSVQLAKCGLQNAADFFWYFFSFCVIIDKSIIFPACSILKRQRCPHQKFYYIQENLSAFNSLLTAERF